jgi:hypothetical protein
MSLINCPECGKQVSNTAVACPNCGHPLAPPIVESQTVVREVAPPVIEKESFPKWILAPILILGAVLIFLFIALFRSEDDNQRNINVGVATERETNRTIRSTSTDSDTSRVTTIPPSSTDTSTVAVPQTVPPTAQTDVTISENPDSSAATSATVTLEAKVSNRTGDVSPVKAEKFYLLDKDLESILREADIDDQTGQGLVNAFGLSVLFPGKFPNVRETALSEIKKHIKYDTETDNSGKAQLKNVKPDRYYLFGITKTKTGFAVWSSPVTIAPGQNALNLSPARLTEIQE